MAYKLKTAPVDAIQWTGNNIKALQTFCGNRSLDRAGAITAPRFDLLTNWIDTNLDNTYAVFDATGSWTIVRSTDWVVKCIEDGTLNVVPDDEFTNQYEAV